MWLRLEIISILHNPSTILAQSLIITESTVPTYTAAQLRGWLYHYYAQSKQWGKYDEVHCRANFRNKRRRLDLDMATLLLREKLFSDIDLD